MQSASVDLANGDQLTLGKIELEGVQDVFDLQRFGKLQSRK